MRWPRRQQQHLERQLGAAEGREVKICLFLSGKKKFLKRCFHSLPDSVLLTYLPTK